MIKTGRTIQCETCGAPFYAAGWDIDNGRKYCSRGCFQEEWSKIVPGWNKGTKGVMRANSGSFTRDRVIGENNVNWKGGISNEMVRFSEPYKDWRNEVFERDDYTCQFCGVRGGRLEADHIYPQSIFPALVLNIDNGRTLCADCHRKTITYLNPHFKSQFYPGVTGDFSLVLNKFPEDEVSDHTKKFKMWDDGGVECETGEFLYGIVRVLKPQFIFESGTWKGWSSIYMAAGLKENGFGTLVTTEINMDMITESKEKWNKLGLTSFIRSEHVAAMKYAPGERYQMIFLDSEPDQRFNEFVKFYEFLDDGGYIFIHDLHRHLSQEDNQEHGFGWPYGKLPKEINDLLKEGKISPFYFPTARGLSGFYKVHPSDYNI